MTKLVALSRMRLEVYVPALGVTGCCQGLVLSCARCPACGRPFVADDVGQVSIAVHLNRPGLAVSCYPGCQSATLCHFVSHPFRLLFAFQLVLFL